MKYIKLFTNSKGESEFSDESIEFFSGDDVAVASFKVNEFNIVSLSAGVFQDWHVAPRRQFIFHFNGEVELTSSSGEKRVIKGGDLVLVEDLEGKGHQTRVLSNENVNIGILPL